MSQFKAFIDPATGLGIDGFFCGRGKRDPISARLVDPRRKKDLCEEKVRV